MPVLQDYEAFAGRHPDTGPVCNALAYAGVVMPHNGEPPGEALLMGVSGGAAFGYFTFDYSGYDPILALITRNTFDPLETLLGRLAIPHDVIQTNSAATGEQNLLEALESGHPAIVWADRFSLPYNALESDAGSWDMMPVLVYGHDGDTVSIADRSRRPLHVPAETFARARARVQKYRFRIITLDVPDMGKLAAATQQGIWQTISLYTEKPPKGSKDNFGFAAYQKWAKLLASSRNKQSWARFFPPGTRMYAALRHVWEWVEAWGAGEGAERGLYADFLDEAATILGRRGLNDAATRFRESQAVWRTLAEAALPDQVPLLGETRSLLEQRHRLFIDQGDAALDDIRHVNDRLETIKSFVAEDFPLDAAGVERLRERLREHVLRIHDTESDVIQLLREAMA